MKVSRRGIGSGSADGCWEFERVKWGENEVRRLIMGIKVPNNKPHMFDGVFGMAYGLPISLYNHAVKFRKIKEL